jgi:hypothetical protein
MWRIVLEGIGLIQKLVATAAQIAQDAVDQIGEGRALGVEPGGADGKINRGMVRNIEEKNLGARRNEQPFEWAAIARQSFFDQLTQSQTDGAQTSQGDGSDGARQASVAIVESTQPRWGRVSGKTVVERVAALDDVKDDGGGGDPRGKAGMQQGLASGLVLMMRFSGSPVSGAISAGAAERFAEFLIHSPGYPVRVARRPVSIMNLPVIFYHKGASMTMRSR